MKKLVFLTLVSVFIPLTVLGGNSVSYRVSLTIPETVEINQEEDLSEEKTEEETLKIERTVIAQETTRQGERVILKTVVGK